MWKYTFTVTTGLVTNTAIHDPHSDVFSIPGIENLVFIGFIIEIHNMTNIAFMLVKQFAALGVSLSVATQADTWLHRRELGPASSETESEST